jgi:PAS domain S-box-containing protein
MQPLATVLREQLETLVEQYDARLRHMPGYSSLPETMRRDLERHFLNLIIQSVEADDYSLLVQYAQQHATQWAARGLDLVWFQQALSIPEELVVPLAHTVETSNFVWQALNRSQAAVWKMIADHTRQTEERYRSIVEMSHTGIMIVDDEFHIVYGNNQLSHIFGYSQAELTGADFRQLLDEESRQLVADRYRRRQQGEEVPAEYAFVFIRKDGQKRDLEMSAVLLQDANGRFQTVAQVLDVTERKQAQAALARERTLLHTLIDSLPDQIFFKDTEGRVILNNMVDARAMRVASPAEALGKNVFDVFPPELAERYNADDMTVIHSGQPIYNREEPGIDQAGQIRWIQTTKVPLTDEQGKPIGLVGFAHDITQLKQSEQRVQELLKLREHQAHTSTEVSQEIAAAPELHELFRRVVTLIKERFNYYHAQIFRYDPALEAIVLVAGYGEVGQHMLADGHQLPMGRGVVGTAAAHGQTILATDVTHDRDWRPNPYLPDTRGELAVPIKLRETVLGILDVQSDRAGALSTDDRLLLEGLCGQIAVAIESTRLLESVLQSERELTKFKLGLERSNAAVFITDPQGVITYVNPAFEKVYGYTPEETLGQTPRILKSGIIPQEQYKQFWSTLLHGDTVAGEIINKAKDGRLIPIEGSNNPITDENGQVIGFLGMHTDITQRTQAEQILRQSEAQLSQALQISKLAYWEYDVEKDLFQFNDQFYSIFHTTAEQEGGYQLSSAQYAQKFVYPEDLPVVGSEIERALNSTDRYYRHQIDHRIQYADGGIGYIAVSINIDRDEQGHILRYYGANQDITERKQIEEALAQEQYLTRALMESVADHIYFKDAQSRFLRISKSQADRFGLSDPAEAIGKTDFDFFTEEHARPAYEDEQQIIRTGQPITKEERETWLDQPDSWVMTTKLPLRDESGKIVGTFGISHDTTGRKQAEALLAQERNLLRILIDNLPLYVYIKDRNSKFVINNKLHLNVMGAATQEEVIGKGDFDFFPPEDAALYFADEQALMEADQPLLNREEEVIDQTSGQQQWVTSTKIPYHDGQGNVIGFVGLTEDITERKQAELRLQELLEKVQQSEQLMRTLIDALPDSIYAKDTESRFTLANLTEIQLSGAATFDELRGKNDFDIYPRELAEQYFADEQPILRDGIPQINREERGLDQAGNPRWQLSTKVPLRDSQGNIIGLVGTTRDITQSKQAEAERERLLLEQQQRALHLQTASEVSRVASSILHLDDLLPQAVELIRARFGFYYVGIFLADAGERRAVLRAGTGEAGHQMLANKHQLEIGGASMIGQCIVKRQARVALDVGQEAIRFNNPLLPFTRSEMALPLTSRGRTIGAMTIQSDRAAAFTSDDVTVLQSMADQISNAVENARLYEQIQAALGDTDRLLQASAELNISQSYADVLEVIRNFTTLGRDAQTIAINVYDRPWTDTQTPAWIELIGYYTTRSSRMDVGTRFPIAMFPSAQSLLHPDSPSIIEDFDAAQADPNTYALFTQRLASKSVIFLPLVVGGQWFGYINVLYAQPTQFNDAEVRRLMALVGQAAVAVQNLRNLASAQQALTETDASYRATQAIGRAQSVEAILEATTHVVDLLGMTHAVLRVAAQHDVANTIVAVDMYAFRRVDDRWELQPVVRGAPISDSAALKPLLQNPEAVVIFADAQNPNSPMPDEIRSSLLAGNLRGSISTSVSVQNKILGFLSFSGPQALNETAEQRLRLTIRTLSDQAAVALQNRLLYEQTRAALQEVDAINRRLTGEAWEMYLHHQAGQQVISFTDDSQTAPELLSQLDGPLTAGEISFEPAEDDQLEAIVSAPILLRGQPIGVLRMRTPLASWDKDTEAILTGIAGHIAQAVENARLIEQTQRTASRERAINEINARVRQTIDLDAILRTAVNELGQSLKAARVTARINVGDGDQTALRKAATTIQADADAAPVR